MYSANIRDPITGANIQIEADTYPALRRRVVSRVDTLRKEIVDLFHYAAAMLFPIFILFISTMEIPYVWVANCIIVVAYIQRAPFWINPFAHIWYLRRCMRAWEQELDRITAPDAKMGYDAL